MPITTDQFEKATGHPPVDDDLERVNCSEAGKICHWACGWCTRCNLPHFQCGHRAPLIREGRMRYFMIFNEKLGKWLPHAPSERGATWVEPTFFEPPRLWVKKAGASRSLAWWLQGGITTGQGHTWDDDTELVTTPKPERIAADWEVIPAQLILSQKTPKN